MNLWAISDLHLGARDNQDEFARLSPRPNDWLILAGDVGETEDQLAFAFDITQSRFAKVIWVPGNHELWTTTPQGARGQARYDELVDFCRRRGVVTPEDPFLRWPSPGPSHLIAPLFLLYDYSFAPEGLSPAEAVAWAASAGLVCADEELLHAAPYPTREAWCHARCDLAAQRLDAATRDDDAALVLVNHFPLKAQLAWLPRIPRFRIWCGTTRTEDWHLRYRASVVVSGHLHIRRTAQVDGVRFEEVSYGYPRQRKPGLGIDSYLRRILPGPAAEACQELA